MKEEDIRKRDVFNRYLELVAEDVHRFFSDRSNFITVSCPACECKDLTAEFEKTGFSYSSCTRCRTLFVNPRPAFADLMKFYADSKSTSFFVNDFFKPVAEARREKIFRPRVDYVEERFRQVPAGVVGDVGAGFGIFLEELRKRWPGRRFIAIEPSLEMSRICKRSGFEVLDCAVEEVSGHDGVFDLLTAFELFEHLYEPLGFLKKIRSLLKPGGHFLLTTLSGTGFDIQVLWEKSKSVSPPHHLNFFNPDSLSHLAQRAGLETVEAATPGKLDWDIVEGMILKEGVDAGGFWNWLARYGSIESKRALQDWLVEHRMSSHMRLLLRRPAS